MTARRAGLLMLLVLVACEESFEREPRITPANESLWALVGLQVQLDALRPYLADHPGRSFSPSKVDTLSAEVLATTESLTERSRSPNELRSARYRVDLISVELGLIQVDALASAMGIGGTVHASAQQGIGWVDAGLANIHQDPNWPATHGKEADRLMASAVSHRDNARLSVPATKTMEAGVRAASIMSGAISLVRLTGAGLSALARLVRFTEGAGGAPVLLSAGFSGGVGVLQVASSGKVLVLSIEEVIALAKAGEISPAALSVWMAASSLHHICTDKNYVSDRTGGPWTPRFEDYFKKAGMSLQDLENLVEVEAHQGPHPEAYHQEVMRELRRETVGIRPNTEQYREALKRVLASLAKSIQTPGSRLNQLVTGAASR